MVRAVNRRGVDIEVVPLFQILINFRFLERCKRRDV